MSENKYSHGITMWKKDSGNHMSHRGGLSEKDVEFLQSLKVGDRLILFQNNRKRSGSDYDSRVTRYVENPNKEQRAPEPPSDEL